MFDAIYFVLFQAVILAGYGLTQKQLNLSYIVTLIFHELILEQNIPH